MLVMLTQVEGVLVFDLEGRFVGTGAADYLGFVLEPKERHAPKKILINLEKAGEIDAECISILAIVIMNLSAERHDLKVVCPEGGVLTALTRTKFTKTFRIYPTLKEAMDSFTLAN